MVELKDVFKEMVDDLKEYRWWGVDELSEKLQVSKRTIYTWLKEGKIEGIKFRGRRMCDIVSVFQYMWSDGCIEKEHLQEVITEIIRGTEVFGETQDEDKTTPSW